ncbi:MAG: N-acetylmuramoyl-L-alanine amidase [Chlamydiae bacterium]|nr:N-acetylmuramoyl-L-alanine amidase [Chlamydiota bacterium]
MNRFFLSVFFLFFSLQLKGFEILPETVTIYSHHKEIAIPHLPKPLVILDPGHGGTDEGAKVRRFLEKQITLKTCFLAKRHLESLGYKVILTRSKDTYLSLAQRVVIGNRRRPSIFISVHFNASISPSARGIEIFYHNSKDKSRTLFSKKLANCILFELCDQTTAHSRGVKQGKFQVIRDTQVPSILVEGGFLTNIEERNLLKTNQYLNKIAKGIAQGVEKYLKS